MTENTAIDPKIASKSWRKFNSEFSKSPGKGWGLTWLAVLLLSLLGLGLAYQHGTNYTLAIGTNADENQVLTGFGDRENNGSFDFRWTLGEGTLKIPDLATATQIKLLISPGPRPVTTPLTQVKVQIDQEPPLTLPLTTLDATGFVTLVLPGPKPGFRLSPPLLTINSATFQPIGEKRTLGIVVRQLQVETQPGLKLPPLATWWGLAISLTLLFRLEQKLLVRASKAAPILRNQPKTMWAGLGWLVALLIVSGLVWLKPGWMALNAGPMVWGSVPALLIGFMAKRLERLQSGLAAGWMAISLALVFYGLVAPIFGVAAWVSIALGLGWQVVNNGFASHRINAVWIGAAAVGSVWGLWQSRLPRTDDLPFYHLYWINELDRLLRQGNFYPRWASDFSYGQGNAVFNYYAPGARYAAELFHLLGLTFNNGAMLTQTLSVVAGGIGTYFWCNEVLHSHRAAMLGAVSWLYFPFTIADLYVGGGLSNTLGAAFLPFVFWTLLRLIRRKGDWRAALVAALPLGGLAFCHTPLTLMMIPVGGIFCLGMLALEYQNRTALLKTGVGLLLAGAVGLSISAFFILPAILEKDLVPFFYAGFGDNAYAPWPEALALWRPIFPNLTNYSLFGTLHPLLVALGLGWLLYCWQHLREVRRLSLFLAALVLLLLIMQLPISAFAWNAVPLFKSIQFTSRLMDFIVVFGAPLIGSLLMPSAKQTAIQLQSNLPTKNVKRFGWFVPATLAVALMGWACFGQLRFAYWPASFNGSLSLKALQEQIKNGDPQYIPHWATDLAAIQTFRPPAFEDKRKTTAQDNLTLEANGPINRKLLANLSNPAQIVLPLFYYPGWHATLNGRELALKPAAQTGLITLDLPAGQQSVNLEFKDTPIRFISNILSLLTVLALLVVGVSRLFWRRKKFKLQP